MGSADDAYHNHYPFALSVACDPLCPPIAYMLCWLVGVSPSVASCSAMAQIWVVVNVMMNELTTLNGAHPHTLLLHSLLDS